MPGKSAPVSPPPGSIGAFTVKVLIVAAIAVVLLLFWRLRDVVVLAFGGVVLAVALSALVDRVERIGLSRLWATVASVLLVILALSIGGWFLGGRLAGEFENLRDRLPDALAALRGWVANQPFGQAALDLWNGFDRESIPWSRLVGAASLTFGGLGNAFLIAILAIYLALDPKLYMRGTVRLLPPSQRERVQHGLRASGEGLAGWLLGQSISMLFVGVTTGIGLALLGVPLAFSLGVVAALLDFVPFFGPIVSGALAVVVAFPQGPSTALYVALLALAIQQLEGSVVAPLVQRWAVSLPPALGLVAVLVFGILFGPLGIVFATPLMVVLMILVQQIYVQDLLEKKSSA